MPFPVTAREIAWEIFLQDYPEGYLDTLSDAQVETLLQKRVIAAERVLEKLKNSSTVVYGVRSVNAESVTPESPENLAEAQIVKVLYEAVTGLSYEVVEKLDFGWSRVESS